MSRFCSIFLSILICGGACLADDSPDSSTTLDSVVTRWIVGIGPQVGSYKYEEPGLMELRGMTYRLNGYLTRQINRVLLTAEATFGIGSVDYYGALQDDEGNILPWNETGIRDYLYEFRLMVGQTFGDGSLRIIPAAGFGVRLLHDLGGTKTYGYDRHSRYSYIPLRLQLSQALSRNPEPNRLTATVEYDHFLSGTQDSDLSDANIDYPIGDMIGLHYPDISTDQNSGSVFKSSLNYDLSSKPDGISFQLGVYYESWRIDESELVWFERVTLMSDPADNVVDTFGAVEPENRTREIGGYLRISF